MKQKEMKKNGGIMSESEIANRTNYDKGYINSYSFKPTPVFVKSTTEDTNTFFGVEIEKEAEDCDEYREDEIAECIIDTLVRPSLWYTKCDGSLDYGTETVSHPISLLGWIHLEDDVKKLFGLFDSLYYISRSSTGLHIHISKTGLSWNKMKKLSEIFKCWDRYNHSGLRKVFQRQNFSYCDMNYALDEGGRYKGFNETSKTFEIRFWQSPSSAKRFYYCLFATAAIATLARNDSSLLNNLLKKPCAEKSYQKVLKFIFVTYPEIMAKSFDVEILRPNDVLQKISW